MKTIYDRLAVGERIRLKRTLLGMTQDEMAEKIDRATKYYADIERGNCGMSIETLLSLSATLDMSVDYILFGKTGKANDIIHTDEVQAVTSLLDNCSEKNRKYALRMLKIFLIACNDTQQEEIEEEGISS